STVGVTDNLSQTPADFSPLCITAPRDSRLPDGGGYQVCGLYDVSPAKYGVGDLLIARASNFGKGQSRTADFFTASLRTRVGVKLDLGGSVDTGRTVEDHCFVVDSPQQLLNCHIVTPFSAQNRIKMYGTYFLPHGFIASGVAELLPGIGYE